MRDGTISSSTAHSARQPTSLRELDHQAQLRRAIIASAIGTTIGWYDFFLCSTVTGLVCAKLYFPKVSLIRR